MKKKKNVDPYLHVALLVCCIPTAIYCGVLAYRQNQLAAADVKTTCTVIDRRRETSGDVDTPIVTITHEVDGKRYERSDEGPETTGGNVFQSIDSALPGKTIPCWYVRGRPDLVIAFKDHRPTGGLALFAAVCLVLLPIGFVLYDRRRKSRRSER